MKTIQGKFRAAVLMGAVASVLAFAAGAKAQNHNPTTIRGRTQRRSKAPVLAVVGDISCQPGEESRVRLRTKPAPPPRPPTPAPLCGNPRRPLRIRLRQ